MQRLFKATTRNLGLCPRYCSVEAAGAGGRRVLHPSITPQVRDRQPRGKSKEQKRNLAKLKKPKARGFSKKLHLPSRHTYREPQQCKQLGKEKEKREKSSAKHTHRERRDSDCAPHQCAWGGSNPSRWVLLERSELGDVDDSVPEYLSVVCHCLGWCLGSFPNLGPPL